LWEDEAISELGPCVSMGRGGSGSTWAVGEIWEIKVCDMEDPWRERERYFVDWILERIR
jgi:hypothetical protein